MGVWRAALETLAGHMWPLGYSLPMPGLGLGLVVVVVSG